MKINIFNIVRLLTGMNIAKHIVLVILLLGCAESYEPSPLQSGYHYTDKTPVGIMYRVDDGAYPLKASLIDYYFAATRDCTGEDFDPENLLVISTTVDILPDMNYAVEGITFQPTDTQPAVVIVNLVEAPDYIARLMIHEFLHVFARSDYHDSPLFTVCDQL